MHLHLQYSDNEFITRLKTCTLPPEMLSHEAHLRLAWIYLQSHSVIDSSQRVCEDLLRYVNYLGAQHKFHTTLTIAGVKMIALFNNRSASESFQEFMTEFPELNTNFQGMLLSYYSRNLLDSEAARKTFVEPDRNPFV